MWNVLHGRHEPCRPAARMCAAIPISTRQSKSACSPCAPASPIFPPSSSPTRATYLAGHADPDIAYNQLIRPWKSRLGLFYIDHSGIGLDIRLIWLTALAIVSRARALEGVAAASGAARRARRSRPRGPPPRGAHPRPAAGCGPDRHLARGRLSPLSAGSACRAGEGALCPPQGSQNQKPILHNGLRAPKTDRKSVSVSEKSPVRSLSHLKRLEAESIHIMREVAAEFANPVMLYSIGKDSVGDAASGDEGVLSRQAALPADACRHDLEIPRDDRVPRRDGEAARPRAASSISTRTAWSAASIRSIPARRCTPR